MNCIDKISIQKYIDNECTFNEKVAIEKHLAECGSCQSHYEHQLAQGKLIKDSLNQLSIENIKVPVFQKKVKNKLRKLENQIIYSLSAACLLLFVLLFVDKKPDNTQNQLVFTNNQEFDSNKPITEQPLMISIVDAEGNRSEFYLQ